ncbi:tetratricopeptide repeat protein [Subsaximicrobium wynnwilliamsii]|uniref:histidine kinase n=1 Tax=Subsaximicrobium wynnwilliamsii TaxID=291179 RepID=A0A5C6ZJU3_9FLAO|nr:tetratricopeptide repeat-containing sensor histidine kinase [Subsaximicrobium wynnwilliamsii]TXD84897.1 tetratricopeptide repeat protein [Subsaximicrobium wynnwilliamsii]TXD90568.1 tetratricopeptide repeat protein [Subsaximicrobium wynnwilliamsii]TXE05043.1 tetratricopeptide repeat protein [Subsaximicrobium wynnwilliamsii]
MKQLLTLAVLCATLFGFSQTDNIDSLTVQLAYQKQDSAKVETSLLLVNALYHNADYKKALLYIDKTERLANLLNHSKGVADANYYKALIYSDKNDYYNAIDGFNKSLKIYLQLGDTIGIAKVNNSIGIIEIKRGNYSVGLENSLSAIKIFEDKNLKTELSSAYNSLAEAYYRTHQTDKALEYNIKALRVRQDLLDSLGIKLSTKNIAMLYSERKEHRRAIEYYEDVLGLLNAAEDDTLKGEILPRIGVEYLEFKNYEKAGNYLAEGLKFNRNIKNSDGIVRSLNAMGSLNMQQGKTRLARIQINEAHDLAERITDKSQLLTNYRLQKEWDSINKNFQNAFFWQGKYYTLKTALDKENTPILPTITEDSQPDLLEDINYFKALAEKKEALNTNKETDGALLIVIAVLSVLLLIVGTMFLLYYIERRKKSQKHSVSTQPDASLVSQNKVYADKIKNLEEVNKVKDRLFSIVSHDLKDSISSIKAFIDLLKDDNLSREEFQDLIPELSENADSASDLLFNLLNWSKSQMQNLKPKPEIFNIQDVFHNKMSLVEQKVEQKRIAFIDESHRDFIYADKSMVEIVIQNLITNAVKFTSVGDVITISNTDHQGKSLICVEDTGVGISNENLSKIFLNSNFTTTGTNNEKGNGLGLTICKELVELNGGRIWVESKLNVGTKFYVELPKMKPVS